MSRRTPQAFTVHTGSQSLAVWCDPQDQWAREFVPLTSEPCHAADATGQCRTIIGDLAFDRSALDACDPHERTLIVLPPGTAGRLAARTFSEARDLVSAWTTLGTVLVATVVDLTDVTAFAPTRAPRIERCEPLRWERVVAHVPASSEPAPAAIVSTSMQWTAPDVGEAPVHFVYDRATDVPTVSHLHEHWCAAESSRRADDGHVEPRLAAWLLREMASASETPLLVVDRYEVLAALVTSPHVDVTLGFVLSATDIEQLRAAPPRNLAGVLSRLSDARGWVFVGDEVSSHDVRRLGYTGRLRILDPVDAASVHTLTHVARQSQPMTRLPDPRTILVAGHDFKFAGELVSVLETIAPLSIRYDKWTTQVLQDVSQSDRELADADVILCEFASHNAVWYSWHKRAGQRLVVHFHGYELFQPFIHDINVANVDLFVFVSDFYRNKVLHELGWPQAKTTVIPNMIDSTDLARPKIDDARFHLGIAGIVPILKRPDRALDLLECLLAHDDRYVLHVRGRSPWDYGWMWQQPAVRDAYEGFYERLAENPDLLSHVSFDAFDADMGRWFRRIGWTLSPSYRETFHLAPVEGQASGAVPVVWEREGACEVFPSQYVHKTTEQAAAYILDSNTSQERWKQRSQEAQLAAQRYDVSAVGPHWVKALFDDSGSTDPTVDPSFDLAEMTRALRENPTPAALDRIVLLMLARRRSRHELETLMSEFPSLSKHISGDTRRLIDQIATREAFEQGTFTRTARCPGTAYLPVHGTTLHLENTFPEQGTPAGRVESSRVGSGPALLRATAADGITRDCAEIAQDVHPLDAVQIAADAVVRAARRHRPAVIVTSAEAGAAWPAVLAARRLGVPVVLQDTRVGLPGSPPIDEFDGSWAPHDHPDPAAVERAVAQHAKKAALTTAKPLAEMVVGLIADEFTARTMAGSCQVVRIPRKDAYLSVAAHTLDVLFVESAWSGQDGEWFHGVAYYEGQRDDLERAIATARARNIPVVFWNKEDPIHFRSFAPTAALCDAVFTTDAAVIPDYLGQGDAHPVVGSMPFYAQPSLHNPLPGEWPAQGTVSYAGTYYGQRYPERSRELDQLLSAAMGMGLTIYDRQRTRESSPYHFPPRYESHIHGGLSYDDVLQAYSAHPVHLNVNSVTDSPTMFSRRVVEIAASGSVVISGPGRGLSECLPDLATGKDCEGAVNAMRACMRDPREWRRRAWQQLRAVTRAYQAEHALTIMFRAAGLPVRCGAEVRWTALVAELRTDTARQLLAQTQRPRAVVSAGNIEDEARALLERHRIAILDQPEADQWVTTWRGEHQATWAEDLLHAVRFVPPAVRVIQARVATDGEQGLLVVGPHGTGDEFRRGGSDSLPQDHEAVTWLLPVEYANREDGQS